MAPGRLVAPAPRASGDELLRLRLLADGLLRLALGPDVLDRHLADADQVGGPREERLVLDHETAGGVRGFEVDLDRLPARKPQQRNEPALLTDPLPRRDPAGDGIALDAA